HEAGKDDVYLVLEQGGATLNFHGVAGGSRQSPYKMGTGMTWNVANQIGAKVEPNSGGQPVLLKLMERDVFQDDTFGSVSISSGAFANGPVVQHMNGKINGVYYHYIVTIQ
ncbi:MAG: hypothetical protein AAFP69_13770, partial [Planctomycetota bacterium]